ncbi:hypothetical protein EYC59_04540 [Candidatus Saccharibacteria bacterium]|nr:MAG: hypothetical protein EYC59_04540 [Candidatus Saccharibacteria bacterium]
MRIHQRRRVHLTVKEERSRARQCAWVGLDLVHPYDHRRRGIVVRLGTQNFGNLLGDVAISSIGAHLPGRGTGRGRSRSRLSRSRRGHAIHRHRLPWGLTEASIVLVNAEPDDVGTSLLVLVGRGDCQLRRLALEGGRVVGVVVPVPLVTSDRVTICRGALARIDGHAQAGSLNRKTCNRTCRCAHVHSIAVARPSEEDGHKQQGREQRYGNIPN